MVKQLQPKKRPDVNKDGTPRQRPGKKPKPDDVKTDRLVLRVHPDLMSILTERARERGVNRSQYVEKLLIGWARLDPRNPRVDMIGKFDPTAPVPAEVRLRSPLAFADRWQKFASASQLLLGAEPPKEWFEDTEYDRSVDPNPNIVAPDDEDMPPPTHWRRRK